MTARELLLYISHRHGGDWTAMMRAIKAKETVSSQEVTDFASTHKRKILQPYVRPADILVREDLGTELSQRYFVDTPV